MLYSGIRIPEPDRVLQNLQLPAENPAFPLDDIKKNGHGFPRFPPKWASFEVLHRQKRAVLLVKTAVYEGGKIAGKSCEVVEVVFSAIFAEEGDY